MPKEPLMEDEFQRILNSCENEFEKQTILILRYTGMHISVICDKENEYDIAFKGKYIHWYRPKTHNLVRIPIHPIIKPFIKEYFENERAMYRNYYNRMITEIGKIAEIEGLSPMSFRHTFGVALLDEGYTMTQVQTMMGVTDLQVITRYTQYSDRQMEAKWKDTGWLE